MFERWDEVELDLRVETTLQLDAGAAPTPLLAAFSGPDPLALVELRPFGDDDPLVALTEVLALLLPLGADRLAVGLPGATHDPTLAPPRATGTPEPAAGPVLVVATAEADRPPRLAATVLPLAHDGTCWQWRDQAAATVDAASWEVTRGLGILLGEGPRLGEELPAEALAAQLGRCVVRGHGIGLSPTAAAALAARMG